MEIGQIPLKQIQNENGGWLNELDTHRKELQSFIHRLSELTKFVKKVDLDIEQQQFRMQFMILEAAIEKLANDIKLHQFSRSNFLQEAKVRTDEDFYGVHQDLYNEIQAFQYLFLEVKADYNEFISQCI